MGHVKSNEEQQACSEPLAFGQSLFDGNHSKTLPVQPIYSSPKATLKLTTNTPIFLVANCLDEILTPGEI